MFLCNKPVTLTAEGPQLYLYVPLHVSCASGGFYFLIWLPIYLFPECIRQGPVGLWGLAQRLQTLWELFSTFSDASMMWLLYSEGNTFCSSHLTGTWLLLECSSVHSCAAIHRSMQDQHGPCILAVLPCNTMHQPLNKQTCSFKLPTLMKWRSSTQEGGGQTQHRL